ncbi:hypothetical protein E3N88_11919 [Mikania micrantha]|uniref:RNase H type-1 domain-containing protein n=1 Tax=Mikania micrantha TaxID=192012 RepID=A0A5N6P422_9ASTR|nr:hypothetical protein E3N88_11919 [Mikania micrantha]
MGPVAVRDNPIAKGSAIRDENRESRLPNLIALFLGVGSLWRSRRVSRTVKKFETTIKPVACHHQKLFELESVALRCLLAGASFRRREHTKTGNCTTRDGISRGATSGFILTTPDGTEFAYAIRLEFEATNNEIEYEALLPGLKLAHTLKATNIDVHVYSLLPDQRFLRSQRRDHEIVPCEGKVLTSTVRQIPSHTH